MKKTRNKSMAFTAILIAFGILIPMMMPAKIVIPPASYTLASHVPIFMALFISLPVAILVAFGTTLGFLLTGMPFLIVLRALSHLLFVLIGGLILQKFPKLIDKPLTLCLFAVMINLIHGIAEFALVYLMTVTTTTEAGYIWTILGLVGLGTVVHGLLDFYLAYYLFRFLSNKVGIDFSLEK